MRILSASALLCISIAFGAAAQAQTGIGLGMSPDAPVSDEIAAPSGYEAETPEPVVVRGDLAIYEPTILVDRQQPDRRFLSVVIENRGNRLQRLLASKIDQIDTVRPVVAVWQESDVQLIPIDQIGINARETVSIGPESLALRLEGRKDTLKEGQKLEVQLSFEPGGTIRFPANVSIIDPTALDTGAMPNMEGAGAAE